MPAAPALGEPPGRRRSRSSRAPRRARAPRSRRCGPPKARARAGPAARRAGGGSGLWRSRRGAGRLRRVARSMRRATWPRASTSRPESSSSKTAIRGRRTASWRVSFLFASPPERSTLSGRCRISGGIPSSAASAARRLASTTGSASAARPEATRDSLRAAARGTPGTSIGYWKVKKSPAFAALVGLEAQKLDAVEGHAPARHLVAGPSHQHVGESALARPVRSHDGVDLAASDLEVDAPQDLAGVDAGMKARRS